MFEAEFSTTTFQEDETTVPANLSTTRTDKKNYTLFPMTLQKNFLDDVFEYSLSNNLLDGLIISIFWQ